MSKGLEALSDLRFNISYSQDMKYKENNDLCDIIEKELKAFEIIKDKCINNDNLNLIKGWNSYKVYLANANLSFLIKLPVDNILTEEEFNLLKEVLKCKN